VSRGWGLGILWLQSCLESGGDPVRVEAMELSQFTDFSLRVLIYVGVRDGERSSVKEIAGAYGISKNHLVKVVHNLSKLGYLETFRGRGGGIALGKPAEEICIGTVVRKTEKFSLVECFSPSQSACCLTGHCGLQSVLRKATKLFLAEFDKVTLADFVTKKRGLRQRLGIVRHGRRC